MRFRSGLTLQRVSASLPFLSTDGALTAGNGCVVAVTRKLSRTLLELFTSLLGEATTLDTGVLSDTSGCWLPITVLETKEKLAMLKFRTSRAVAFTPEGGE